MVGQSTTATHAQMPRSPACDCFGLLMRRMGSEFTAHGFRSSFRDWTAEKTSYAREVTEAALAHAVENQTEAAYRRTDLFERRRDLRADWAAFATKVKAEVVQLHGAK